MAPRTSRGHEIQLGAELAHGGEGKILAVDSHPNLMAKIYHRRPTSDKAQKLALMVDEGLECPELLAFAAWPSDTLLDDEGVIGFVMPRIEGFKPVHELYGVESRRSEFPRASWAFLVAAARNFAGALEEVHGRGHLIGDINETGVLVSPEDATVRLIDCDSFQIRVAERVFTCDVGVPLFTPPELQGKELGGLVRTPNHDEFGAAVLIFQLLFLGRHPFFGRFLGEGEMTPERAIRESRFVYGAHAAELQMSAPLLSLPLSFVPRDLADLFERAFSPGSLAGGRPSAAEWRVGLERLQATLQPCPSDRLHVYPAGTLACPWCAFQEVGAYFFSSAFAEGGAVFVCRPTDLSGLLRQLAAETQTGAASPVPTLPVTGKPLPRVLWAELLVLEGLIPLVLALGCLLVVVVWAAILGHEWVGALGRFAIGGVGGVLGGLAALRLANGPLRTELERRGGAVDERETDLSRASAAVEEGHGKTLTRTLELRGRIQELQAKYGGLQEEYDAERASVAAHPNDTERRSFLRSHRIPRSMLGDGAKISRDLQLLLRTHGFESALDVIEKEAQLSSVWGLGTQTRGSLKSWARALESEVPGGSSAVPAPLRARDLVQRYERKRTALRMGIERGIAEIHRVRAGAQVANAALAHRDRCAQALAQARADLESLKSLPERGRVQDGGLAVGALIFALFVGNGFFAVDDFGWALGAAFMGFVPGSPAFRRSLLAALALSFIVHGGCGASSKPAPTRVPVPARVASTPPQPPAARTQPLCNTVECWDAAGYRWECDGGDAQACFALGVQYEQGTGVAKDVGEAAALYRDACEAGSSDGCFNLGVLVDEGTGLAKSAGRAAALYLKACDGGVAEGCFNLGVHYDQGQGVRIDGKRAAALFQQACDAEMFEGCAALADEYYEGRVVKRDRAKAAVLYAKACQEGVADACVNAGQMRETGAGVSRNAIQAVELYRLACDAGSFEGCSYLGDMYAAGSGVRKDRAKAAELYSAACDGGYEEACDQ